MFYVINKDRIISVVIAIGTVFTLFLMTTLFGKMPEKVLENVNRQQEVPVYSDDVEFNNITNQE